MDKKLHKNKKYLIDAILEYSIPTHVPVHSYTEHIHYKARIQIYQSNLRYHIKIYAFDGAESKKIHMQTITQIIPPLLNKHKEKDIYYNLTNLILKVYKKYGKGKKTVRLKFQKLPKIIFPTLVKYNRLANGETYNAYGYRANFGVPAFRLATAIGKAGVNAKQFQKALINMQKITTKSIVIPGSMRVTFK